MSSRGGRSKSEKRRDGGNGWDEFGGYMNAKISKLQAQFQDEQQEQCHKDASVTQIFSGVAIFVNGYTNPTADQLKRIMKCNGGVYQHYYSRSRVTHIIANNLPNSKIAALTDQKIVKPQWIVDSLSAGKLLPHQDYLLYTGKTRIQPGISFEKSCEKAKTENKNENFGGIKRKSSPLKDIELPLSKRSSFVDEESIYSASRGSESPETTLAEKLQDEIPSTESRDRSSSGVLPTEPKTARTNFRSPGKAGDKNFVADYYNHSRLHHISTWGNEFKAYVQDLQQKSDGIFIGRSGLREFAEQSDTGIDVEAPDFDNIMDKVYMHVDMDCFFVSVGLRDHPELKGKPVAVTHSRGKGKPTEPGNSFQSYAEIASCSYEARQAGVKNGMFMGPARELCPNLLTIPYNFEAYNQVSRALYDIVASYTHDIEAVSCDEMFVDVSELLAETAVSPLQFVSKLRQDIFQATQCTASCGLGGNILLARLATRKAKPNGQFLLTPDLVNAFMKEQNVKDLPGVGRKLNKRLVEKAIFTCGDLQKISLSSLKSEFGPKTGLNLYNSCRGIDDRSINSSRERKSVSAEINYGIRFKELCEAEDFIKELAGQVETRLKKIGTKGKTITLKLMIRAPDAPKAAAKFLGHGICDKFAKAVTLPRPVDDGSVIARECIGILKQVTADPSDFRGMGIQVSRLEFTTQNSAPDGRKSGMQSILSFAKNCSAVEAETSAFKHDIEQKLNLGPEKWSGSKDDLPVSPVRPPDLMYEATSLPSLDKPTSSVTVSSVFGDDVQIKAAPSAVHGRESEKSLKSLANHFPPLPTLPSFLSPHNRSSGISSPNLTANIPNLTSTPRTNKNIETSTPQHSAVEAMKKPDEFLISPSQVDTEVLSELPADIRRQIESEMKRSRATAITSRQTRSQGAGCSSWSDSEIMHQNVTESGRTTLNNVKDTLREEPDQESITALPNLSQLDPSCLEALPEDVRLELRDAYTKKESPVKEIHPLIAAARNSPQKSPVRGRGRGRGSRGRGHRSSKRGGMTRRLDFPKPHTTRKVTNNVQAEKPEASAADGNLKEPEVPTIRREDVDVSLEPPGGTVINLCGAVTIDEVKALLIEWLASTNDPEDVDIDGFTFYLEKLIQSINLEQVYMLLKFIKRRIFQNESNVNWTEAFHSIQTTIQAIVISKYGAPLAL